MTTKSVTLAAARTAHASARQSRDALPTDAPLDQHLAAVDAMVTAHDLIVTLILAGAQA